MLQQVSVFMENNKGTMCDLISLFSNETINLTGFVTNDSAEYGIVRLLVSDSDKAEEILTKAGHLCQKGHVLGIEISDEPKALEHLLKTIRNMNINIDYMYMSYNRYTGWPTIIMHCDSMEEVEQALQQKGYSLV